MPIILPLDLTTQEIRVLQEFRRLTTDTLPLATLAALRHPSGGGEAPLGRLVERGFLEVDGGRENFSLTQPAREFLAIDAKPDEPENSAPVAGADGSEPVSADD